MWNWYDYVTRCLSGLGFTTSRTRTGPKIPLLVWFGFGTSPNPNWTSVNPETLNQSPLRGLAKKAINRTEPDFDSTLFFTIQRSFHPMSQAHDCFWPAMAIDYCCGPLIRTGALSHSVSQSHFGKFWDSAWPMIADASVVWPFQLGKESATKSNPDTACSWQAWQWPFCQLRNTARLSQRKGWNMLRSSTRHHVINLVAIERDLSEKFEVFDWGVLFEWDAFTKYH